MASDSGWRPGFDPWALKSEAEAREKVRDAENRHPSADGSAAEGRSLRAWLPLLVVLAIGLVVLVALSLPR